MKAYVRVIYSSEGGRPSVVEEAFGNKGFTRVENTSIFKIDVEGDEELEEKLDDLHSYLKGLEVKFSLPGASASKVGEEPDADYRERLEKWRLFGVDVDNLAAILEDDPEAFKERAQEIMKGRIERLAADREAQIKKQKAKKKLEEVKNKIIGEIESSDGVSFQELNDTVEIDANILSGMLDDMIDKGRVVAEQRGSKVIFVSPR